MTQKVTNMVILRRFLADESQRKKQRDRPAGFILSQTNVLSCD
jgi:hypothetical protein